MMLFVSLESLRFMERAGAEDVLGNPGAPTFLCVPLSLFASECADVSASMDGGGGAMGGTGGGG